MSSEPSDDHLVPIETEWLKKHPKVPSDAPRLRRVTALKARLEGRGWVESRAHIFVTGLDGEQPRRLTDGPFDDGPPAWSPDGNALVFSSSRFLEAEQMLMNLCGLNVDTGEIRRLNIRDMSEVHAPVFSPDGRMIAFFGSPSDAERRYMQGIHLWVMSREGGDERNVSADLDRQSYMTWHENFGLTPLEPPSWSPDGSVLYFNAADHGDEAVYAVSPSGGMPRRLPEGHVHALAPQVTPDGETVACIAATPTRPFELCTVSKAGGHLTPVTDTNQWLPSRTDLVEPEHVQFKGADGWDIEGWLIKPPGPAPTDGYPLILHVHGGPYLAYGNTFYFQFQALAASGFASLYINPRGSAGYGQDFVQGRDYGENDFQDLMLGLDAVLEQGEVDPTRLGVTGLSFGGFMTNWIVGQTDRFAAALTINGIASWMSMHESSDIGCRWPGVEWGGAYWESEEMWQKFRHQSPISYAAGVKTPLLLLGSEKDYRVPIEQEEAMLTALRVQGKVVEMIRFPNANHLIATSAAPHHRVEQWELAQAWFERWLGRRT
jgi:dipeptidyl aminopeptidase/acylaminoacyl peptidase